MFQMCALIMKLNATFYELCSDVFLGLCLGIPCLYKEQHVGSPVCPRNPKQSSHVRVARGQANDRQDFYFWAGPTDRATLLLEI